MKELQISLAAARVNAGFTQQEAAEKMHVSKRTLCDWELGKRTPSAASLHYLADIYGIHEGNIFLPTESR